MIGGAPVRRGGWAVLAALSLVCGTVVLGFGAQASGAPATGRVARLGPAPLPPGAVSTGRLAPERQMRLEVVLPSAHQAELHAELAGMYRPGSAQFHHWLTPNAFARSYGPDPGAVAGVRAWLESVGLRPGRLTGFAIEVAAPASTVEAALGVSFDTYREAGDGAVYAADRAPLVPTSLDADVSAVLGLDDVTSVQPQHFLAAPPSAPTGSLAAEPRADGLSSCAGVQSVAAQDENMYNIPFYTADQVGAAYGVGDLTGAGQTGAGQTVAVYEVSQHSASDVSAYETCFGLANPVTTVPVDGGGSAGAAGTVEADLDIEQMATQAPGASIMSYEGPNTAAGAYDVWQRIVEDDTASVISASLGLCEPDAVLGGYLAEDTLLSEAAAQGQTVLVASGDSGSEGCYVDTQGPNIASTELAVEYPASSQWVTAVGGTNLGTGPDTVWNVCEGQTGTACAQASGGIGASGGGVSRQEDDPPWQPREYQWSTTSYPCVSSCRNVPDVSANAGAPELFYAGGQWVAVGGTSVAAPLVAGIVADTDQRCTTAQGDVASSLYALASDGSYGTALTDVTSGDNDLTRSYNPATFSAGVGYDPASGLGTPLAGGWSCAEVSAVFPQGSSAGSLVTVEGLGLEQATISFGSATARVVSADADSATVVVPAGTGTVTVSATSPVGKGTVQTSFTYPAPPTPTQSPSPSSGYWLAAADGGVFAFNAPYDGSTGAEHLNQPIVGMAADPLTGGYWLVARDGGVFAFNAPYDGSTGAEHLNQPIVGMAADPLTGGYWLVAADGGVFAFNAPFHGSAGAIHLNRPIVGMAADPLGGYWLVASDGGIFAYDAPYQGSTGAEQLNQPIVGMAEDPSTGGYWLVAADGGVFAFNAPYEGSTGAMHLVEPIVGMSVP